MVDLGERRVVATIPMGTAPNGVSFSPVSGGPTPMGDVPLNLPGEHEDDRDGGGHGG